MSFISLTANLANKCLIIKNKLKKEIQSSPHLRPTLHNGLFSGGGSSPCIEPCLDLSTTATFFCHQGGRCGEVQLQNK